MQTSFHIRSQVILIVFLFLILSPFIQSQNKTFIGTEKLVNGNTTALRTIAEEILPGESVSEESKTIPSMLSDSYVLGGNVLWIAEDGAAISSNVKVSGNGSVPVTAWTLNNVRVSLYPENNNVPLWEFPTTPYDASVAVSTDGSVIAVPFAQKFFLLEKANGSVKFEMTLADSFYATAAAVTRSGDKVVFLAQAYGGSNTARAYCMDVSSPTPVILWTYDVPANIITNWTGVTISASGNKVILTGRNHIYVLNTVSGALIWDNFVDNTEAPSGISGNGDVIVTADNSGFVQTRLFNSATNQYNLLWQYRIPVGSFTNWASSVGISADGKTILAGSLLFFPAGYDGSVVAFDTYGNGTPKWVATGLGDLVDDISVSDDGRVAAAVTWGDLTHTKPDLFVFDVQTGTVTFDAVTAGSFFSVDLTPDGSRVIAGGKGVHAREFGMGGRTYFCEINLGGGNISGTVDLAGTTVDQGVVLTVPGTPRTAVTDASGNYIIRNVPPGTHTVKAEKPGYNFGSVSGVIVTEGNTTAGVNFSLPVFPAAAPVLSASNGLSRMIVLNWTGLLSSERKKELAKITGDEYYPDFFDVRSRAASSITEADSPEEETLLLDSIAVFRSLSPGGPYARIAVVSSTLTSYTDSAVFPLRNYYYVLTKFNETGQSVYSNEALGKVSDSLLTFNVIATQSSVVPVIDGTISAGEWTDAVKIDISDVFGYSGGVPRPQGSVFLYMKFNQQTKMLYVAGEDFLNTALDDNDGFGFYIDDNNNGMFESPDALPIFQEGNYWAYWHPSGPLVRFRQLFTGGGVGTVEALSNAPVAFSAATGHLQGEFAIPMGFSKGNELQVYAPDKKIGLGAFLIDRSGGTLFNGWWPQTMNSVFNPMYFGDVNININLTAPPYAPSGLNVAQQGGDLLVTWSDPTLGLNNDPLPVPPKIRIYRNYQYLTTVNAGVQTYLDQDVDCTRWYEYQFDAMIIVGSDTLISPMSNPSGEFACSTPTLVPVKYDDGGWEAFYVVDFTYNENKFALRVTPTYYPVRVLRLETLVNSRDAFDFTINSDSSGFPGKVIAGPFRTASVSSSIVSSARLTIPGDEPPLIEEGDFWVVVNYLPNSPDGPGIGVDLTQPVSDRGMYYTTTGGWINITFGNLMITTYIADPPPIGVNDDQDIRPLSYGLNQNYPNPFNPSTVISYQVPQKDFVTLEIFDALGQKIKTVVNEVKDAGRYTANWDGTNISGSPASSGIYFYRIKAGQFSDVKKMMLIK